MLKAVGCAIEVARCRIGPGHAQKVGQIVREGTEVGAFASHGSLPPCNNAFHLVCPRNTLRSKAENLSKGSEIPLTDRRLLGQYSGGVSQLRRGNQTFFVTVYVKRLIQPVP